MAEITATDAARNFADILDAIEHKGEHYTIIRRGKAIAHLEPAGPRQGSALKELLLRHRPDPDWAEELHTVRDLLEVDDRQ